MDKLLLDLFEAYYDARRNKRNTHSQLKFELDVEHNLIELYDEIREQRYQPNPCTCFIIEDPVKREVFASDFRDRVVRPYYRHVTKRTSRKFNRRWQEWDSMCRGDLSEEESKEMLASINSYLGYFQHFQMNKFLKRKNICIKFLNTQFQFVEDYKKVCKVR